MTKHIHPKLKRSIRLYFVIALIVLVLVIINAIRSDVSPLVILLAFILGIIIGFLFSRIYKISWDKDAEKVINKMDIFGIILLVIFIVLRLIVVKDHLANFFVGPNDVSTTSLALLAGTFYGRILGIGRFVLQLFREQQLLPKRKNNS
jgi:predicted membrane channel-forming protein YqfA (hemolysin III family)